MEGAQDFMDHVTLVIRSKNRFTLQKYSFFFPGREMLRVHPEQVPFDLSTKYRRCVRVFIAFVAWLRVCVYVWVIAVPCPHPYIPHPIDVPLYCCSPPLPCSAKYGEFVLLNLALVYYPKGKEFTLDYVPRMQMERDEAERAEEEEEQRRNAAPEVLTSMI